MPPKRIEKLLWFLLPPACREQVLGDLQEKCKSPREYTREGLAVVAPVIVSRIRRTTDYQLLLIEAFAIYGSFVAAAVYLGEKAFLYQHAGFARLALPTLVAVLAMLIGNAYFGPVTESVLNPILQSTLSLTLAFLGQTAIFDTRPALAVPLTVMLFGSFASVLVLSALRILSPPISTETKAVRFNQLHRPRQPDVRSGWPFRFPPRLRHRLSSKMIFACAALLLAAVVLLGLFTRA